MAFSMDHEDGQEPGGFMKVATSTGGSDKPRVQHVSLVPVTLKQIQMAQQDPNEDKLRIDGRDVTQVRVVGQIHEMSVSSNGNNFTFHLDDGTAYTEVKVWIHDDPNGGVDYHQYTKENWKQGIYVEVFGSIKVLSTKENKRSIMAQRVNVITDFNLVTHHFLMCIHAHLFATKGGTFGNHVDAVVGGIQKFEIQNSMGTKIDPAANPYNNSMPVDSGSLTQKIVDMCKACSLPKGLPLETIRQKLPQHSETEIRDAIKSLLAVGDIYTSLVDHYKA